MLYHRRLGSILLELYAVEGTECGKKRLGTLIVHHDKYKLCNHLPSKFRSTTFSYRTDLRSLDKRKKHKKSIS